PAFDVYVAEVVVRDQYRLLWLCGFVCLHAVLLVSRLVGVTRDSLYMRNILVFQCEFHAAPRVELTNRGAVDFLPWCLVVEGLRRQLASALGNFVVGDQYIDPRFVEIHANAVACSQDGQIAASRGFRAGIQNRRRIGCTALPAVTDRWQRFDTLFDERSR